MAFYPRQLMLLRNLLWAFASASLSASGDGRCSGSTSRRRCSYNPETMLVLFMAVAATLPRVVTRSVLVWWRLIGPDMSPDKMLLPLNPRAPVTPAGVSCAVYRQVQSCFSEQHRSPCHTCKHKANTKCDYVQRFCRRVTE